MHCSHVTELLSEYVDDVLDPSTRAGVEKHLADCRNCTAALASLRTYLEAMGSLPQVQAPSDFLTSVHERLEQSGCFRRLMYRLFFPLKVKLPFEVAGLVAASLLVVLLYRGTEPEKAQYAPVSPVPSLQAPAAQVSPTYPTPAVPAQVPSAASRPSPEESREDSRSPAAARPGVEEREKDQAPPVSPGSPSPLGQTIPAAEAVKTLPAPTALQDRSKSPAHPPLSAESPAAVPLSEPKPLELVLHLPPPATVPQARGQALARKSAPALLRETVRTEPQVPALPASTLSQIKELVEQARGSVLSVDSEQPTPSAQVVTAQVPARNYPEFVKELRRLGQLEEPAVKSKSPSRDGLLQLHIRLVPSSQP